MKSNSIVKHVLESIFDSLKKVFFVYILYLFTKQYKNQMKTIISSTVRQMSSGDSRRNKYKSTAVYEPHLPSDSTQFKRWCAEGLGPEGRRLRQRRDCLLFSYSAPIGRQTSLRNGIELWGQYRWQQKDGNVFPLI